MLDFAKKNAFLVVSGIIFSITYALHSDVSGSVSRVYTLGTFTSFWPYAPRFLVAWAAHNVFGGWAETAYFRALLCFTCWIPTALLSLKLGQRLGLTELQQQFIVPGVLLVSLGHYALPNVAAQFVVYDLPATVFYLTTVLLLTSSKTYEQFLGALLLPIFYLNNEGITVALFHAAAFWLAPVSLSISEIRYRIRASWLPLSIVAALFLVTIVERSALLHYLHGNSRTIMLVTFYEGDRIRFVANLSRVFSELGNFQQFAATGFGAVLLIPLVLTGKNTQLRAWALLSLPPMVLLFLFGNFFTELRIYKEFVPLFGIYLAVAMSWPAEYRLTNQTSVTT